MGGDNTPLLHSGPWRVGVMGGSSLGLVLEDVRLTAPHRTDQGLSWPLAKSTSKISSLVSNVNFGV